LTTAKTKRAIPVVVEQIGRSILVVRGHRVLLDEHLAVLYGVQTRVLIQAVKRNLSRFPEDFMLQLSAAEWSALRSQIVISKVERGGRRYAPYAFTEQGVAMLSSVLNSERAIAVNIEIMRAFVRVRELLASTKCSPNASLNSKPDSIKNLPSTMMPSPPFFPPFENS